MGEILRVTRKQRDLGRDSLTDEELFLLAGFGAVAARAIAGRTEQQRTNTARGFEIFENLPTEEQEKYDEWTPEELQALWPLIGPSADNDEETP